MVKVSGDLLVPAGGTSPGYSVTVTFTAVSLIFYPHVITVS
jgi:hypothetical protein